MKIKTLSALLLSGLLLTVSAQAASIKVGTMSGKEASLLEAAKKVAKEKFDLDVEIVEFDDYVTPNISLADKAIDANAFQHKPYLESSIQTRGFKIVPIGNTFVYPIGAYSKKLKNIDELAEKAVIAIPNDPSNGARSLILLHKKGIITLNDPNNLQATVNDIVKNPKKLEFRELDAAQLPQAYQDASIDLAFINSNYAVDANINPSKDALIREDIDSPYVNIIAAREEDKDRPELKQFVEAYQTDAVKQAAEEAFKGAAIPGW